MFINIKFSILTYLALIILGLSGCETMEGAGRDIQDAGESIEEKAK